jgi:hypothetical protein
VPIGGALEHARDAQQFFFLKRRGEDLQANRQARIISSQGGSWKSFI